MVKPKHFCFRVVLVASITLLATLVAPAPASATDVDLGSPATIEDLLASPEYLPEHADIARLYRAFLNRLPDVAGLQYWIGVYEDGADLFDLSWAFSNSQEFRTRYGSELSNNQFVDVVYSNVLGRAPDQAGFDYWLGIMNDGLPRHETVFWIVAGEEFKATHPFAGTYPNVEASLLTATDVPASYTDIGDGRLNFTDLELAGWDRCDRARVLHTNTYQVFHGQPDGGQFLLQEMYAFSKVADATAAVTRFARLPIDCPSTTSVRDGLTLSINYYTHDDPSFVADVGDESAVVRAEWVWSSGLTYSYYLWVVRDGTAVTITDLTIRNGSVDYSAGRGYAATTSSRVRSVLGLA